MEYPHTCTIRFSPNCYSNSSLVAYSFLMPVLKHDDLALSMTYSLEKELFEHSFAFRNECLNVVLPHLFMP